MVSGCDGGAEPLRDSRLLQNIVDQILEAQLKLGYEKERVGLYYPVASLKGLLGVHAQDDWRKELEEELRLAEPWLGKLSWQTLGGRVEIEVPARGAQYVHEQIPASAFLTELIRLFRDPHACTLEKVREVFARCSDAYVCQRMPEGADFDYVLYFTDPGVDPYYYCVKEEMGHMIYHRFTREDYEGLL